jgi:hypothetical protein
MIRQISAKVFKYGFFSMVSNSGGFIGVFDLLILRKTPNEVNTSAVLTKRLSWKEGEGEKSPAAFQPGAKREGG